MQCVHKDCKKINMASYSNHFICSMLPLSVLFSSKLNKVLILMVLLFYEKCMLEKVTIQRTPQFADFSLLSKELG